MLWKTFWRRLLIGAVVREMWDVLGPKARTVSSVKGGKKNVRKVEAEKLQVVAADAVEATGTRGLVQSLKNRWVLRLLEVQAEVRAEAESAENEAAEEVVGENVATDLVIVGEAVADPRAQK